MSRPSANEKPVAATRSRVATVMVLTALSALLVVLVQPANAATKRAGVLRVSVTSATPGESVRLSGELPPRASRRVILQRLDGKRWTNLAAKKSTRTGAFRFRSPSVSRVGASKSYRVLAPAAIVKGKRRGAVMTPTRVVRTVAPPAPTGHAGPGPAGIAELRATAGPLWLFDAPTEGGRTVASTVDPARSASATIGSAGGEIEVSTARGDSLTLTIPAGALLAPTEISATPVATMAGATEAGATPLGLELQPEGLTLLEPAILDVLPAEGNVARQAVGATANGDGSATRPTWVIPDSARLTMPVHHFSYHTILVANGENGFLAEYFTDAEYAANIQSRISDLLRSERDAELDGAAPDPQVMEQVEALLDGYYTDVLVPLIERSGRDCAYAESNYYHAVAFGRQLDMLGIEDSQQAQTINAGFLAAMRNCWTEATAECLRMDPGQFRRLMQYVRYFEMMNVTLANGETPDFSDPDQVRWCGTVNGWIDVQHERHAEYEGSSIQYGEEIVRVWVTANPQMYWSPAGDLVNFYSTTIHDAGSLVSVDGYSREESWPGAECPEVTTETYVAPPEPFTFSMSADFDQLDNPVKQNTHGWVDMYHRFTEQNYRHVTCDSVYTGQFAEYRFRVPNLPLTMTWDRARSAVDVSFSHASGNEYGSWSTDGAGTLYIGRDIFS